MNAGVSDERVARGMRAQLDALERRISVGDRRLGWKIGLNAPAAQRQLGLAAPVVGFLTCSRTLALGARVSFADITGRASTGQPAVGVEPEIAVHLAADVPGDADIDTARNAIGALGAALEVIELDRGLDEIEGILAANVFHRAVVFGPTHDARAGDSVSGVSARVFRNGREERSAVAEDADPGPAEAVRFIAGFLSDFGEALLAGDRIIAGSLTEPVWVEPGDEVVVDLGPLGAAQVGFTSQ